MISEHTTPRDFFAHSEEVETAYRRGVDHAAEAVIDAVAAGATLDDLIAWAGRVTEWREGRLRSSTPPQPGGGR